MTRLSEIYEGWKNFVFRTPQIEALAKERIAVCVDCEFLSSLNVCTRCTCPTAGKARSPESRCLENKWKDGWGKESPPPPEQSLFYSVLYIDGNNQELYFENIESFEKWLRGEHQTGEL